MFVFVDVVLGFLVIFGQVYGDWLLVVIEGGGFCSLESYLQELVELCYLYVYVYFKLYFYDV